MNKLSSYRRELEHERRMELKRERIEGLKALMASWEAAGNYTEVKRLIYRIRVAEQELRYMDK